MMKSQSALLLDRLMLICLTSMILIINSKRQLIPGCCSRVCFALSRQCSMLFQTQPTYSEDNFQWLGRQKRWRLKGTNQRKRNSSLESGLSGSPTKHSDTEQQYWTSRDKISPAPYKRAHNSEQRQSCQEPLRGISPPQCWCWEAAFQIQIAASPAFSLARHFQ